MTPHQIPESVKAKIEEAMDKEVHPASFERGVSFGYALAESENAITSALKDQEVYGSGHVLINKDGIQHIPHHAVENKNISEWTPYNPSAFTKDGEWYVKKSEVDAARIEQMELSKRHYERKIAEAVEKESPLKRSVSWWMSKIYCPYKAPELRAQLALEAFDEFRSILTPPEKS